ncbi:MAG: hypothetical protein RLZZ367_2238, partial [Bacteroidota bacterium]
MKKTLLAFVCMFVFAGFATAQNDAFDVQNR